MNGEWIVCLNRWNQKYRYVQNRASKSPDFSGDLPIFDKIMKISRSPDLGWKSPDFLPKTMLARSIASFAIAAGESIFSHILPDTVVPHARAPGFCDRVTVIRPNPFIGYQSQRGRGLSRDTTLLYILSFFFVQCRIMLQNKWMALNGNYRVGADTPV